MAGVVATVDLSAFMSCTLPLQVDQVEFESTPTVEQDVGRTGTSVKVEGEGFIQSTSAAAFTAALAALAAASAVSGADFTLRGLSGAVVHQVAAANCLEGGPHVAIAVLKEGSGPFFRRVRFSVTARVVGTAIVSAYKYRTRTGSDGLQQIGQTGMVVGPGAGAYYLTNVLALFAASAPADRYVTEYEAEYPYTSGGSAAGLAVRYALRAQQLADPLPGGGAAAGVVDGEVTKRTNRDEQQRLVTQYDFDLTLTTSAYDYIVTGLRSAIDGKIVREAVAYSSVRRRRLRATFEVLSDADHDGLLSFTQTLSFVGADDAYQEFGYPGADPIAIKLPDAYARVTQSGSAVGLGKFPQPPDPLLHHFAQRPARRFTQVNQYEFASEWSYDFLDVEDGSKGPDVEGLLQQVGRSSIGGFYNDSGGGGTGGN